MSSLHLKYTDHKISNDAFILMSFFFSVFFIILDFNVSIPLMVVCFTFLELFISIISFKQYKIRKKEIIPYFLIVFLILANLRPNGYINEQPFYLFTMLMFLYIIPLCKPSDDDRNIVIFILVFVAIVISFLIILSKLSPFLFSEIYLERVSVRSREYSKWIMSQGYSGMVGADTGLTGMYVIVGLSFVFTKFLYKKQLKDFLLLIYLFVALILLGRRSELLIFIISSFVVLYAYSSKRKKIILFFIAIFVLIIGVIFIYSVYTDLISYHGENRIINTFVSLVKGEDVSNGRSVLYNATWNVIKQNAFFGIGWGGARTFLRVILPNDANVHNIYLQLLCEIGVIGTSILLLFFLRIFRNRYKAFCSLKKTNKSVYITSAYLLSLYLIIFGVLNNPIYVDYFWFIVSIVFFMSNNLYNLKEIE